MTPLVAEQAGIASQRGVLVTDVHDGSRAEAAGFRAGDVIAEVDHHTVAEVAELRAALKQHKAGAPIVFLVRRDGEPLWLAVGV